MLRTISNGKSAIKSLNGLKTTFIRCMSVQENPQGLQQTRPIRAEKVNVTLCGRIIEAPFRLEHGSLVLSMKTQNDHDEFHARHRVLLTTQRLQNLFTDRLSVGQRALVNGFISYTDFQSDDGHRKQSGWIMTNELFVCQDDEDSSSDVNEVNLFGRVQFQPHNSESATFLEVATFFFDRKEQQYKRRIHQVLIKDNDKMRQLASSLDAGSGVFIRGFLRTEIARTKDGKTRPLYYIRPRKLIVNQPNASDFDAVHDES